MSKDKRYWNKRRVLITGHEGFLGSWLTKKMLDLGANVVGVDVVLNRKPSVLNGQRQKLKAIKGDIANFKFIDQVIAKHRPQTIFHLAAEAEVEVANKKPVQAFKSNIEGTWNILESARGKKYIDSIVVASSDKAYGVHKKLPYKEDYPLQGDHPYDVSKSCADLLCNTYHHSYGVPVCITRCGNIFGPGDYHYSRIVPDGIRSSLKGKQLVIRSNGKYTRDYIYVEDIVDGYILLARKMKGSKLAGEAFNFSQGKPVSVLELFNRIAKLTKSRRVKPKILNQAQNEIEHQHLSSKKARKVLGWKNRYSLDAGLKKTIFWYQANGASKRH